MKFREFGPDRISVSAIGLGCDKLHPGARESEFLGTIRFALDCGVTLFDTAAIYGNGSNETLLGQALRGRRDEAVICTKFGHLVQEDGRPGGGGRPEHVVQSCERSLKALGVDCIDVYIQHLHDPLTPVEDTVGAMADLVRQGKIRYLGLSNIPADIVRRAHAVHPIAAVQAEYSFWTRYPERDLLPTCEGLGITYIAYWPLALGLLAGTAKNTVDLADDRFRPLFLRGNLIAGTEADVLKRLTVVDRIAAAHGCTPAQVALAWILAGDRGVLPIPGTRERAHLQQNIAAVEIRLTEDERRAIDAINPA